jgi:hypothetical protein
MRRYRAFICDSARWEGFPLRSGDVIVTTPPKCGTTWMQTLCLLLIHGAPLPAPVGELSLWVDQELKSIDDVRAFYDAQPHRRVLKTHTPMDGIPWRDDVTYVGVGRDPRDVALSFKDHSQNMDLAAARRARDAAGAEPLPQAGGGPALAASVAGWIADDAPVEQFRSSLVLTVEHLSQLWELREKPNVVLFHYADMRADLPGTVRRLAEALGIAVDDDAIARIADAATFESMQADADRTAPNTSLGLWRDNKRFFAEGRVGAWRDAFTPEDLTAYEQRLRELGVDDDLRAWLHR